MKAALSTSTNSTLYMNVPKVFFIYPHIHRCVTGAGGVIGVFGSRIMKAAVSTSTNSTLYMNAPKVFFIYPHIYRCVTGAGGVIGVLGSRIMKAAVSTTTNSTTAKSLIVSEWVWVAFGVLASVAAAFGLLSFQRPACDIFVAGVTQV